MIAVETHGHRPDLGDAQWWPSDREAMSNVADLAEFVHAREAGCEGVLLMLRTPHLFDAIYREMREAQQ